MAVIELDGFKKYSNEREIKLPGIDKTWKVKFYRKQSSDEYEDELLELAPADRKKRLTSDLAKFKKACVDGLSALLQDDGAGEEIYEAKGNSTEIFAQIIGKINQTAD